MVLSTPVKVVSGVAAAFTAVAGTALAYKYSLGLYFIEKLALDEKSSWKIKSETEGVAVLVSASENSELQKTYGVSNDGTWTCILKTDEGKQNELKNKLKEYFGVDDIVTEAKTAVLVTQKSRVDFVNNCSKYRNPSDKQTNNKVTSKIKVDSTSLNQELETIFGEIPLNSVEKKVYAGTGLNFAVNSFTLEPNSSPQKAKGTITATNSSGTTPLAASTESWTCTIEGTPMERITLIATDNKDYLETFLRTELEKSTNKQGLVKSCARNRTTNEFSAKTVTSTLKLNVSKDSEAKLKFDENQLEKVFSGDWINPTV